MPGRHSGVVSSLMGLIAAGAIVLFAMPSPVFAQQRGRSQQETERLYEELAVEARELERESRVLVKVARIVGPAVVHLQASKSREAGGFFGSVEETGSGVIVKLGTPPSLYVLTNRHVVEGAQTSGISIHLDDRRVIHPIRVWEDQPSDVALLKIAATDLAYAHLGDSAKLEIGSRVIAVGSPFGLSRSVTYGIISARGRRNLPFGSGRGVINQDFLQTDAAINPGNSGGPLVNLYGEIVGINTAIASNSGGNEGIGFSIPINLVKTVINRILENGKVERGFLGVILQESSRFEPERAAELGLDRSRGALIVRVSPESPASRADLRPDDVVLKFNDTEIEDQAHLILLVSLAGVGQKATLEIWRDRQSKLIEVVLGDREALQQQVRAYGDNPIERLESLRRAGEQTRIESLGLEVIPLTSDTRAELDYPEASSGLLVTEVDPRGPVGYRIQPLDLIDQVEREPITRAGDLEGAVRKYFLEEGMVVRIRRRVGDEEIVKRLILRPKAK